MDPVLYRWRLSRIAYWGVVWALSLMVLVPSANGQDLLSQFEDKVTTMTLDNGLTVVVVERHEAPVVSMHTYADVGSVDEPAGRTGLAHMFEHMAFKGTTSIGTTDIEAELQALRRQEEIYLQLRRERLKGPRADSTRIDSLEQQFAAAQEEAKSYVDQGEFENILKREGVTGMNAYTTADATGYMYSLPSNKLELFFAMEADRFRHPVLREFYTERDVVMEERRQRTESSPTGRLIEEFLTTAYKAHPYGQPTIGHMSDLQNLSRTDAKQFFDTYYTAENLTIGIAGDVDPARVRTFAEKYFGPMEGGEDPLPVATEEPEQLGERRVVIREQSKPFVIIGYHRGSMHEADDPVYDVLAYLLSRGRTSRLHKRLVETEMALSVQATPSYPGEKYGSLFVLAGAPNRGVSPDTVEQAIYDELASVRRDGVTQEELDRAKTRARADLIGNLDSNSGLARQFSTVEARTGDWRTLFRRLDRLQAVTGDDVQRVAREVFERSNRTVAQIKTTSSSSDTTTAAN